MDNTTETGQIITEHIRLEFADAAGESTALEAELIYDPTDPYAVTMVFKTGAQSVRWTFGRDLLIEGLYDPTGDGDVHIWPCLGTDGSAVVIFELCSPDGEVLVQGRSRDVNRFVQAMLTSVPEGSESKHVDLDAALIGLFA